MYGTELSSVPFFYAILHPLIMDPFSQFDWTTFLQQVGTNPFQAMGFFLLNGGWIALVFVILWGVVLCGKNISRTSSIPGRRSSSWQSISRACMNRVRAPWKTCSPISPAHLLQLLDGRMDPREDAGHDLDGVDLHRWPGPIYHPHDTRDARSGRSGHLLAVR